MLKRDWSSIAKLIDVHTRVAISLATDPEILKCFERGFPNLFTEGDDEGPFKIPLPSFTFATSFMGRFFFFIKFNKQAILYINEKRKEAFF